MPVMHPAETQHAFRYLQSMQSVRPSLGTSVDVNFDSAGQSHRKGTG